MPPKMIILIVWLMRVKEKLDDLGLVEDEDYRLEDILQPVPQGGYSTKKVYILTPEAFKTCLMRARKYPNQKVDPVIYSKYYLLLEKTYGLYRDYQNILLVKQLEQKDEQLEQKDHQLETQAQQIEEQRRYTLDLQEGLLGNIPARENTDCLHRN